MIPGIENLSYCDWHVIVDDMKFSDDEFEYPIPMAGGYWLNNDGVCIPLHGNRKHIDEIISNPPLFGLTIESVSRIYAEENEPLGIEGRARKRIILDCVKRGWIRVRRYPREGSWTVNVYELNDRNRHCLTRWAAAMSGYGFAYDDVSIDLPDSVLKFTMRELASLE